MQNMTVGTYGRKPTRREFSGLARDTIVGAASLAFTSHISPAGDIFRLARVAAEAQYEGDKELGLRIANALRHNDRKTLGDVITDINRFLADNNIGDTVAGIFNEIVYNMVSAPPKNYQIVAALGHEEGNGSRIYKSQDNVPSGDKMTLYSLSKLKSEGFVSLIGIKLYDSDGDEFSLALVVEVNPSTIERYTREGNIPPLSYTRGPVDASKNLGLFEFRDTGVWAALIGERLSNLLTNSLGLSEDKPRKASALMQGGASEFLYSPKIKNLAIPYTVSSQSA